MHYQVYLIEKCIPPKSIKNVLFTNHIHLYIVGLEFHLTLLYFRMINFIILQVRHLVRMH